MLASGMKRPVFGGRSTQNAENKQQVQTIICRQIAQRQKICGSPPLRWHKNGREDPRFSYKRGIFANAPLKVAASEKYGVGSIACSNNSASVKPASCILVTI